jgi:hypothetical protein
MEEIPICRLGACSVTSRRSAATACAPSTGAARTAPTPAPELLMLEPRGTCDAIGHSSWNVVTGVTTVCD